MKTNGNASTETIFSPCISLWACVCVCVFSQVLDFERESEYILVLSAQNPVALVRGRYGPASTATVSIYVDDVNEGPILSQSHYEVTVREGEEPGRVIATIRGYDPDSHPIRYTLQIMNAESVMNSPVQKDNL